MEERKNIFKEWISILFLIAMFQHTWVILFFSFSFSVQYPDSVARGRREGSGSTEATEMILNNLFYITTKVKATI